MLATPGVSGPSSKWCHISTPEGEILRAVGDRPDGKAPRYHRESAYPGGDRFWAAPPEELGAGYELELWTTNGRLLVDDTGLLIVFISVPDRGWRYIGNARERRRRRAELYHARYEVIDPASDTALVKILRFHLEAR